MLSRALGEKYFEIVMSFNKGGNQSHSKSIASIKMSNSKCKENQNFP